MKKTTYLLLLLVLYSGCHSLRKSEQLSFNTFNAVSQKKVIVQNGAVVSAHPLASKVGLEMLKMGGNAFDAAIATQLALAVVYPNAGNLGGGGFMVARLANGDLKTLDYREKAPIKGFKEMYIDENGKAHTELSQNGHLSAGVPGTVAGLFATLPYARLPMKQLIQPAIELAEKGFLITAAEARSLNSLKKTFEKYNTVRPVFVKAGPWSDGDTLIQKDLAATLKRIRDNGQKGFYEGETARLIVEEMKRGHGIIGYKDLKNYKAIFREPHVFTYKGYSIVGMPMPSSGGLLLNQMMKMVEDRPLPEYGFLSPRSVQLMIEAERRAFADRAEYMGDADFYPVPVSMLSNESYLQDRMKDFVPGKAGSSKITQPGLSPVKESEETTHLSIIDRDGNAVSITTTLNNSYGSKTVVGGAGFFLNDEMDDFSIKPGVPNMFGAVGGEANAIMPGKRMLSSMTPTIVLKDNAPFLVLGTPGGTTIPTSVFQTIIDIIDFDMNTEDAVNQPKFHHQWLPDRVDIEKNFPQSLRASLEKMGYTLQERESIGRTEVIKVLYKTALNENFKGQFFEAVADNRGNDAAEGY
ncbi:MAG: gamma-glutamyltransferase [Terrimonas sp.]|nr:gamma-glutamyltransferase [Terrimonas sp.]